MAIQLQIYDAVLKATASLIGRRVLRPVNVRRGIELWRIIDSGKDYSNIIDARCIPPKSSLSTTNRFSGLAPPGSAYAVAGGEGAGALYLGDGKSVRAEAHHYHRLELADDAESPSRMKSAALSARPEQALVRKLSFAFETTVDFALGDVARLRSLLRTDVEVSHSLASAGLGTTIDQMLIANDYSACLAVGHAMHNAGFQGLFAETARRFDHLIGQNIVLFGANGRSFVRELDPLWMLIASEDEHGEITVTAYPQKAGARNRVGTADSVFRTSRAG